MTRQPSGPEIDCLTRLSVSPHYRTELPFAIVNGCIAGGWVRDDGVGFVHLTDAGRRVWMARR